jgi:hypothetical protein
MIASSGTNEPAVEATPGNSRLTFQESPDYGVKMVFNKKGDANRQISWLARLMRSLPDDVLPTFSAHDLSWTD